MNENRKLFFLTASLLVSALGALLAFKEFGHATVPQLLGVGFVAAACLAAGLLPPGAP